MYVDDPIDQPGFFWLPSNEAERIPGTLKIDETGQISLSLFGWRDLEPIDDSSPSLNPAGLPAFANAQSHSRIHGLIQGKAVTLDRCIPATSRTSLSGGISEGSYIALRAYVGAWWTSDEDVTFSRIHLHMTNLHEWLMMNAVSLDNNFDDFASGRFSLSFNAPEPLSIDLPSGATLSFRLAYSSPSVSVAPTDISFYQRAYLRLDLNDIAPLEDLLATTTAFQRLLSVAVDQPCEVTALSGFTPDLIIDGREAPITIYTGRTSRPRPTEDVPWHRMLFTFNDVRSRFPDMVINWLSEDQRLDPALNLYDALMAGAYQHADGRFLATAQSIEALHRRLFPEKREMSDDEFTALCGDLVEASPSDKRDWVRQRLQHANEPTFRQRVRDLVESFEPYFGTPQERRDFIHDVVDARNRLTHLPTDSDDKPIDGKSLILMQKKLEILFQLHVLRQLGFDDEAIKPIANDRLLQKLDLEFF